MVKLKTMWVSLKISVKMYYNEKLQQIFLIFKTQNSWAVTSLITTLVFNRINNYE